jgi:hypothetical protein
MLIFVNEGIAAESPRCDGWPSREKDELDSEVEADDGYATQIRVLCWQLFILRRLKTSRPAD